ncbi:astacin [Teladorsagia circumcincta]|uniref:Metalloendopeptidase n=1 Tax=Teladorsagia circumcincta TaxID=45464 RepID=A0A2G9U3J2_TELCI|nr:astacin [Teladorsagia circumcincta]
MIKALLLFVVLLDISFSLSVRSKTASTKTGDGGFTAPLDVVGTYEESNARAKRQASERAARWAKNTVYYYFDTSIVDKALIRRKLKSIRDRTCINFVENATAVNRIKVTQGEACKSHVGMKGGEQIMSLPDPKTNNGAVEHEFMHALGFLHTYVRHDRNSYIKVNLTNVKESCEAIYEPKTSKAQEVEN